MGRSSVGRGTSRSGSRLQSAFGRHGFSRTRSGTVGRSGSRSGFGRTGFSRTRSGTVGRSGSRSGFGRTGFSRGRSGSVGSSHAGRSFGHGSDHGFGHGFSGGHHGFGHGFSGGHDGFHGGHHGFHGHGDHHAHSFFHDHGLHLSFSFGYGYHYGHPYYYPYHSYVSGYDYAFYYPYPVTYAYAPYGFYGDAEPVYVTRYAEISDDYAKTDYKTSESKPAEDKQGQTAEPKPATNSPVTERFLRDASTAFKKSEYQEAARLFRLAALADPDSSAPLFALGQSLLAIESDQYAARVLRRAVNGSAELLKEPGDIVGVYKNQAEFDRVMKKLEQRAQASAAGSDARFLLGVQRYFAGDPRAKETFRALAKARPEDTAVKALAQATAERFKAAKDLPPIK